MAFSIVLSIAMFILLQVFDTLSTLVGFKLGAQEFVWMTRTTIALTGSPVLGIILIKFLIAAPLFWYSLTRGSPARTFEKAIWIFSGLCLWNVHIITRLLMHS